MSLGIVTKAPEGLVLAAESRVTISVSQPPIQHQVNFDNATKLLSFSNPNNSIGVVTYGLASIGLRTVNSFIPEFESTLPTTRLSVQDFASQLSGFLMQQWNATMPTTYSGQPMVIIVGGFNDGEPHGRVFLFEVPLRPAPIEQSPNTFGITWGGQREFVDRLVQGYDGRMIDILKNSLNLQPQQIASLPGILLGMQMPIPLEAMSLQDCVDLVIFFIRTTITAQRLTVGIRGCGGAIDVATITRRDGLKFVQQKQITGER